MIKLIAWNISCRVGGGEQRRDDVRASCVKSATDTERGWGDDGW